MKVSIVNIMPSKKKSELQRKLKDRNKLVLFVR